MKIQKDLSLPPEKGQRVLETLTNTDRPYPKHALLHELVEKQTTKTPSQTAVIFGEDMLSYGELNRRANQLAHFLRATPGGASALIGICMERSLEMVIGLLGILKAGAAYVPIDPDYPEKRIEYMLKDAGVTILLTQSKLSIDNEESTIGSQHRRTSIFLDSDWQKIARFSDQNPGATLSPDDLAYVIYTSGSTGNPKGAMNTHRGICNRLLWMQDEYQLTADDTVLQKTPFSFDVSVWEFFWPLISGAKMALAKPGGHRDSAYLAQLITAQNVTVMHFVPSMLQLFLEEPAAANCQSLRDVICSGEALTPPLRDQFFSIFKKANLHNLYGPTEAAVDVTFWKCQRGGNRKTVPIGRPVANMQIYILDEKMQPVPVGETGELYIGGAQVGRGYLNQPELTAERFIEQPPSLRDLKQELRGKHREAGASRREEKSIALRFSLFASHLYRTGDLGRQLPNGAIEFLGRIDHQVKIRGFRIELGEIEAALEAHSGVKRAVVVARKNAQNESRLIAYAACLQGNSPTVSTLREFLAGQLPEYMIPATFVFLEKLPLLPNGKIDRSALPEPGNERPDLSEAYLAPRSPMEKYLANLWRKTLGLSRVGVNDRFFELGGTSLQAGQIIVKLQAALGESIFVVTFFDAPTIAEYARFLEQNYSAGVARVLRGGSETKQSFSEKGLRRGASQRDVRAEDRVTKDDDTESGDKIDAQAVAKMQACIPRLSAAKGGRRGEANPPAMFILAPPRSGTSLLRVMLAGHPGLFAAAELQLLNFNTLRERRAAFEGKFRVWLEGAIRAVMEIKSCEADAVWQIMADFEAKDLTTKAFYGQLQKWIGERMLVEKSPQYALDSAALQKAEREFKQPRYIHLARHPYAMITSFEKHHMDQVLFAKPHDFSPRHLGELVWLISHQNIANFLADVPENRQYFLRYEDLVSDPETQIRAMCERLSLDFHPDLLNPYKNLDQKMVDGIYAESRPMGDERLLEQHGINPKLADRWKGVLDDNFLGDLTWDLAGQLGYKFPTESPAPTRRRDALHASHTIHAPAAHHLTTADHFSPKTSDDIAIIGMAGRFPGAENVDELWENLRSGVGAIRRYSADDLHAAGVDPAQLDDPDYVPFGASLDEPEYFDAAFFGYHAREVELMDPQQRIFLECAYSSLENAGYNPQQFPGKIGVFGGVGRNAYFIDNIAAHPRFKDAAGDYHLILGSDKDYSVTRVAYKLNLRGPAFNVQTACSTSAVAIHLACQSIRGGDSDMAIAGGCRVMNPPNGGYFYVEGGPHSPDGCLRTFDANANGMVRSSGAAFIVLKPLAAALRDGDTIHAVIKSSAINNDGDAKIGFTAPSVQGQVEVITSALERAGIDPQTIGFVEAHGTGTILGDPIEVAGLTQAYRQFTTEKNYCALGSLKTNIGHLDAGAGVAGVIKAALALKHRKIPATLNFTTPNPQIDFANSPFFVNSELRDWPKPTDHPRRAAVNSLGLGGTNAHIILEEAPEMPASSGSRDYQLLLLSAKSEAAAGQAAANLAEHLDAHPEINLADAAFTLQTGRQYFNHRRTMVCKNRADAIALLRGEMPHRSLRQTCDSAPHSTMFMFAGGGAQYLNMGQDLYQSEPLFRQCVDECAELLQPLIDADIRELIYPSQITELTAKNFEQPSLALPALFAIQYATAKLWTSWGIRPAAMIGHSMGEYTAACLAGVFSLKDALAMVVKRGQLFETLPEGSMLSVPLPEARLGDFMDAQLSIAAINKPDLCVASGPTPAIEQLQAKMAAQEIESTRIRINVAAHSQMVAPILDEFGEFLQTIAFHPPEIPLISNVSGDWAADGEIANWEYWVKHLRQTVRFADGLGILLAENERIFLEVGPGQTLAGLARQHPQKTTARAIVSSLRHPKETTPDAQFLLTSLGRLWLAGVEIDWTAFYANERRYRIPLPTYPFERKRFWIDPPKNAATARENAVERLKKDISQVSDTDEEIKLSEQTPSPVAGKSRKARICAVLQEILEDLSGVPTADLDIHTTFLELGFDSLFLTQANNAFQRKFKVKISFRQLFEEAPTIDALAAFIDSKLSPEAFPDESPAPVSQGSAPLETPVLANLPTLPLANTDGDNLVERVINQQLQAMSQLMAQQLAALQGGAIDPATFAEASRAATTPSPPKQAETVAADSTPAVEKSDDASEGKSFGPWRPLEKRRSTEISEAQQANLQQFIARYTAKTAGSKAIAEDQRPHYADPQSVNGFNRLWKEAVYPIAAARSSGARVVDVDGNEYVDLIMGFGVNLFGHSPEFVREAVQQQLAEGWHLGVLSPLAKDVAKMICEMTGFERVNIVNTGTEAVMAAVRAARTVTGKEKIAMFEGDYHGLMDEFLVRGVPTRRDGEYRSLPASPGIPRFLVENTIVLKYEESCLDVIRANADELAAVLIEPVSARDPSFQPKEMIRAVRKVTAELEIPLIFDELITGFRLHPRGAQAWYGVEADLCSYGKALSGGLPIGVVAGKAEYIDAFDGGMWQFGDDSYPEKGVTYFIGTFVRNPLSLAAANAALQRLKAESPTLQKDLNEKTAAFAARVNALFERKGAPIKLVHGGSIIKFVFTENHPFNQLFFITLRDKGMLIRERACYMSTAHRPEDLDFVLKAIESAVDEMQTGGLLPVISLPEKSAATAKSDDFVRALPLTAAQMEIWLATGMGDDASCAFNISTSVNLRGKLDETALRSAIQQLIDGHEALRTTFDALGEFQHIAPQMRIDVPLHDLSALPETERQAQLHEMLIEESRAPFDLLKGPLFRAFLAKLSGEQHVLVLSAHHLICDGWSLGVLINELGQIYAALSRGQVVQLPEPLPFSEYARQKKAHRQSADGANDAAFWLAKFADDAPVLDLPADHARPPLKTYRSGQQFLKIERDTFLAFKKAAMKQGATAFAALMATFAALLQRLSGQDDFAIGLAAAGQSTVENGRLVGHCVNLLPLRATIDPQQTFGQFLKQMKGQLFDAFDHSEFTFGDLLEKLNLPRDPSRTPLISAILTYETDLETLDFGDLRAETSLNPKSYCNFDLELYLTETPAGLTIRLDHNVDLFEAATVQRWLGYFQTLLESAGKDADQPITALPLMPETELRQILIDWNATEINFPRDACIHRLFEAQVAKTPAAVALIFDDEEITYRELNARANRLAHFLQKRGIGCEHLAGVCLERSPEMVIALLAVLKAGGAYLPIDPEYPDARIAFMLKDSGATVLLTQSQLLSKLSLENEQRIAICLDNPADAIAEESAENPQSDVSADNLAYLIYTSGSTGNPKGAMNIHRGICNRLLWMQDAYHLTADDTVLQKTPFSFDVSVWEFFWPLISGAKMALAKPEGHRDSAYLAKLIVAQNVTVTHFVPSMLQLFLEEPAAAKCLSLRDVICSGEALTVELRDRFFSIFEKANLHNLYGPTEAAVDVTFWKCQRDRQSKTVPIGRPVANTQIYILDAQMQPVPVGKSGEIYIGGVQVGRGYWNQPELTAERFIEPPPGFRDLKQELPGARGNPGNSGSPREKKSVAPLSSLFASRLYRTGDLGRWLPDGNIEFLGRMDYQIKLRGFRIELGEIEAVLTELPGVEKAVVVVRELNPGDQRLIAYAAVGDEANFKTRQARKLLRSKLPEYMVPSIFVPLAEIPLSPNGKIDRNALPLPDGWGAPRESRFEPPQTETEQKIVAIWQSLIGVEQVGARDNFFDIGGHSLLAMRMIVEIEKEIGCRISPREVIVQTLGQIAALCEQRLNAEPESPGQPDGKSLADRVEPGVNGAKNS